MTHCVVILYKTMLCDDIGHSLLWWLNHVWHTLVMNYELGYNDIHEMTQCDKWLTLHDKVSILMYMTYDPVCYNDTYNRTQGVVMKYMAYDTYYCSNEIHDIWPSVF